MPPKAKFSRAQIADTALKMIKENGLHALSARELGKRLGTSSSPIFSLFENMDDVKLAARELAMEEFINYISDYREYTPAAKRIGMMIVNYGINEPELFKLLFMQEHKQSKDFKSSMADVGDVYDVCIGLFKSDYGFNQQEAELLFEQLWTLSFGMGAMCAMKVCTLTEQEIGMRLGLCFASYVNFIKSNKINNVYSDVVLRDEKGEYHGQKASILPY